MERKLTAILSADVQGYSRLMGADEVATVRTLTAYREVMAALIQQYRGRVVDSPGDNLLAEFASAVDAVQGAVEIQRELKSRNAELPPDRSMEYRIGINVGDVIIEGERLTPHDVGRWRVTPDGQFCTRWNVWAGRWEGCGTVYREGETFELQLTDGLGKGVYRRVPGNPESYWGKCQD
jgi:hypothetical protein